MNNLPDYQPKNNYFSPAVPPLAKSNLLLPGGKITPYYYSLGVDSTIPFVSLQGGGANQKHFTWGEMIEVAPGQTVAVKNESYMQGDIQINSGNDFSAKPPKISLPVTTINTVVAGEGGPVTTLRSFFPADTRACRRAYLKFQIETGVNPVTITFTGKPKKHSFIGTDLVTGEKTYTETFVIPPLSQAGSSPMGYGAQNGLGILEPMALTDQVSFEITYSTAPTFINSLFFYVLEY